MRFRFTFDKSGICKSLALVIALAMLASNVTLAASIDPVANPTLAMQAQHNQAVMAPVLPINKKSVEQKILIQDILGDVWVQRKGSEEWVLGKHNDELNNSDKIKTDVSGSAHITFDKKADVYVAPDTMITVEKALRYNSDLRQTLLTLDMGRIKADIDKLKGQSSFQIKTPTALASVRGTTLYLGVTQLAQGISSVLTDLYVDEGSVRFDSLINKLESLLVDTFGASSAAGDGTLIPVKHLDQSEREAFVQAFERIVGELGNPQTEVEDTATLDDTDTEDETTETDGGQANGGGAVLAFLNRLFIGGLLKDTQSDLISGRTLLNGQKVDAEAAKLLSDGIVHSGSWDFQTLSDNFDQGIVTDGRITPLNDLVNTALDTNAQVDLIEAKRNAIGNLGILAGQTQDNGGLVGLSITAANAADVALQKINANRVVVDQRFTTLKNQRKQERQTLRNSLNNILINQLELRELAQQEQLFDAQTGKVFTDIHGNRVRTDQYIDKPTDDSVRFISLTYRAAGALAGVSSFTWLAEFNQAITGSIRNLPWNEYLNVVRYSEMDAILDAGDYALPEGLDGSNQFIVHESADSMPALFPTDFTAEAQNPAGDKVVFYEHYTNPMAISIGAAEGDVLWAQGLSGDSTNVFKAGQSEPVAYSFYNRHEGNYERVDEDGEFDDGDRTQGVGPIDLEGFNPFDPNGNNPAFFIENLTTGSEETSESKVLVGELIPFGNDGQIFDVPGFTIEGLRGLLAPNQLVNGGNYNLELILSYGSMEYDSETQAAYLDKEFSIDVIITPEILQPYSASNTSTRFPDVLKVRGCEVDCKEA